MEGLSQAVQQLNKGDDDGDDIEDETAAKTGYYYGDDDDCDSLWPTNVRVDFGRDPESSSFETLGTKMKGISNYLSYIAGNREDEQTNDFLSICIANKYNMTKLSSLTEALQSSYFDDVRDKITELSLVSCTIQIDDSSEIEDFCSVLGTFSFLKVFTSESMSWCAAGSEFLNDGVPREEDHGIVKSLLIYLIKYVNHLSSLYFEGLIDDTVLSLCDAIEEKWRSVNVSLDNLERELFTPISLSVHRSNLSVDTFERIACLMSTMNCFQELDFTDLHGLSDAHAMALAPGVQNSTFLHTLDLHLNARRVQGLKSDGIEAIVEAIEVNRHSILCKFDVSAEEQPVISEALQSRLRKCLRLGCNEAKRRVRSGSICEADKKAKGFMQYAYMPAYFKHEVHEH